MESFLTSKFSSVWPWIGCKLHSFGSMLWTLAYYAKNWEEWTWYVCSVVYAIPIAVEIVHLRNKNMWPCYVDVEVFYMLCKLTLHWNLNFDTTVLKWMHLSHCGSLFHVVKRMKFVTYTLNELCNYTFVGQVWIETVVYYLVSITCHRFSLNGLFTPTPFTPGNRKDHCPRKSLWDHLPLEPLVTCFCQHLPLPPVLMSVFVCVCCVFKYMCKSLLEFF